MIGQQVLSTYDEADGISLLANPVFVLDGTGSVYFVLNILNNYSTIIRPHIIV